MTMLLYAGISLIAAGGLVLTAVGAIAALDNRPRRRRRRETA